MAECVLNAMIQGRRFLRKTAIRNLNDRIRRFLKQSREEFLQRPVSVRPPVVENHLFGTKYVEQVPKGPVFDPPGKSPATHLPAVNIENTAIRPSDQHRDFT